MSDDDTRLPVDTALMCGEKEKGKMEEKKEMTDDDTSRLPGDTALMCGIALMNRYRSIQGSPTPTPDKPSQPSLSPCVRICAEACDVM